MKYGVALPYITARDAADLARLAEESGWDGVFLGDAVWTTDPIVSLSAAAVLTSRIKLGTLVTPAPLRQPVKIASEAGALDNLSNGRLVLGLSTGAVWMGWQAFPDAPLDVRTRAELLDETVDTLTLFFLGQPFDYAGKHFHYMLRGLDPQYYPPRPVQQPRVPLWVVGAWPRPKSMRRILKCDGWIAVKLKPDGEFASLTPDEIRAGKLWLEQRRPAGAPPLDVIIEGSTAELSAEARLEKMAELKAAGATWWIEGLWEQDVPGARERILQGPPEN